MSVIDVIIPVFERDKLLVQAVESVLAQTYSSLHITVVDDASQNFRAVDTLKKLSSAHQKKITIISLKKNHGPAYCRNLGAANTANNYLAFLDSDDLWHPDKLSQQVDFLNKNPHINYVHTAEQWLRGNEKVKQKKRFHKQGGFFIERCMERCLISTSAIVFKRHFWNSLSEHFLAHFRIVEDYEFWLRLNFEHQAGYLSQPLTIKRTGNWPQLSSTQELDRYRVLALHRFFRLYRKEKRFLDIQNSWKIEILKKTSFLLKGSIKYKNQKKAKEYQNWIKMLEKL